MKVEVLRLVGSRSRENVASTPVVRATPVAPGAGACPETVGGGGGAGLVVNDQLTGAASATPSTAFTCVFTVAV